jgi:molybdenum cofactor guanylyltransferase
MPAVPPLKGLVLAGGFSERMGSDKALLKLQGITLLHRAVALLRTELDDVRVSVRADQSTDPARAGYPLLLDVSDVAGPAAGLLAAHRHAPGFAWLVVACDMPLFDKATLRYLLAGRDSTLDATALIAPPATDPEPLCAIYEPATLAAFHAQVGADKLSPRALLRSSKVRLLPVSDSDALRSANTAEEFKQLSEQLWRAK